MATESEDLSRISAVRKGEFPGDKVGRPPDEEPNFATAVNPQLSKRLPSKTKAGPETKPECDGWILPGTTIWPQYDSRGSTQNSVPVHRLGRKVKGLTGCYSPEQIRLRSGKRKWTLLPKTLFGVYAKDIEEKEPSGDK